MAHVVSEADAPVRPMRSGRGRSLRLVTPAIGSKNIDVHISVLDPGSGDGPFHFHSTTEEVIYVLSGTMRLELDDRVTTAGPGTCIWIAAGERHSAGNAGAGELRILEVKVPPESDFVIVPAPERDTAT
jgi:quercetin dioxygenase-like cupin family protein